MNKIIPFKGRSLDRTKQVKVYRHIRHKGSKLYSVFQNGLVVAHTTRLTLRDCIFKVNPNGQKRVRKEKVKNVHAWINGFVTTKPMLWSAVFNIKYDPYKNNHFTSGESFYVGAANLVWIGNDGVFANGIVEKGIVFHK